MLKKGFTMVEILIVIAIIGVLSVSLIPNLSGAPAKARDLAKKKAVSNTHAAIESYRLERGSLPVFNDATDDAGTCLNAVGVDADMIAVVFDGDIPNANTLADAGDCVDGDVVYPMYKVDGNNFTVSIEVESKGSATNDDFTKFELSN